MSVDKKYIEQFFNSNLKSSDPDVYDSIQIQMFMIQFKKNFHVSKIILS